MKIGIFSKSSTEFFKNGCNQQSLFLYETLDKLSNVECYILLPNDEIFENVKTLNFTTVINDLSDWDIIIFLSNKCNNIDNLKLIKSQDVKIVYYNCGNEYYIYNEDIIFGKHNFIKDNTYYKYYDELWCIPNYKKDKYFYETMYNIKCKTVPYVWNNTIIKKYKNIQYESSKILDPRKRLLICEPNMQTTKTCLIPLLICERLYKEGYRNIQIILLCKPETDAFKKLLENLEIYKNNCLEIHSRLKYFDVVKQLKNKGIDCYVVSHHQDNPLNFLHLETMYLGYPLIHNCEYYKTAGYYYNNIKEGTEQLLYAINNHSNNTENYKRGTDKILFRFSPENITNITLYSNLLDKIYHK